MLDATVDSEFQCRICLENGKREDFISPCRCSGSSRWVHRDCLDKWRSVREDRAFSKCTECLASYKFVNTNDAHDEPSNISSQLHYCCLVTRDLSIFLVFIIAIVGLAGLFVYTCDIQKTLIQSCGMESVPLVFYTLAGLVLCLFVVGMTASCAQICPASTNPASGDICFLCSDTLYWGLPVSTSGTEASTTTHCCCYECFGSGFGNSCNCCECGTCCEASHLGHGSTACGECSSCTCESCSVAGMEEGALICFAVVIVLMAVVGLIVCIFIGAVALNNVISRHVHVLRKWTLTKEYIVADLAADSECLLENGSQWNTDEDGQTHSRHHTNESPPLLYNPLFRSEPESVSVDPLCLRGTAPNRNHSYGLETSQPASSIAIVPPVIRGFQEESMVEDQGLVRNVPTRLA